MLRKSFTKKLSQEHFEIIYAQFAILSELTNDIKMFKKKYPDLTKEGRALFFKAQEEKIRRCKDFEKSVEKETRVST